MKRENPPRPPAMAVAAEAPISERRTSVYEDRFVPFDEKKMDRNWHQHTPLMVELNRTYEISIGLGALLRIVSGNGVQEDCHNDDDLGSEPPLNRNTIARLTNLAAALCERMAADIDEASNDYDERTGT